MLLIPLAGSSYITKRIRPSKKYLTNIQDTDDNECFKWCLISYLNPADHNPRRIRKADKDFTKRLDFKDMKFSVKIRDILKIKKKKKKFIGISNFGYKNKKKYPIYISGKCCEEKHVNLHGMLPPRGWEENNFFCLRWTSLWRTFVGEGYMGGKIVF